jgi:RNA polymerase subunit RPABC4/transcription elongation factor Spt4
VKVRCSTCGREARRGLKVCPECGATLRRARLLRRSIHCRSCEGRVPAGLHICPYCGATLRRSWRIPVLTAASAVFLLATVYILRTYVPWAKLRDIAENVRLPAISLFTTPTSTSSPTRARTLTRTPTPTPTWTPVPRVPTETATLPPLTATRLPTATRTPQPRFSRPRLLEPANQVQFRGGTAQIRLSWEPSGVLADDEWYALSLRFLADGVVQYSGTWTKDSSWIIPTGLYTKAGERERAFQWDVTVMKQTGSRTDGGRLGVPLSATSETRTFFWY